MYAQFPMYQRQGKTAFKKDLNNILKLSKHLGEPEKQFKSIHIGGTNGKGSTSHILASVLQEAGYKVGLYTSPHLKDFRERIRINGQMIRKNCVINFIKRNQKFLEQNELSFFEMTVGMAFDYFAKKQVDIAIIEVGLGGRLDSTNIIIPELSIITNISFDHTQMLGDTLEKIAFEKAGIIKTNVPVIIGESVLETKRVFEEKAEKEMAPIYFVDDKPAKYKSDLQGNYQVKNIKTVLTAINILQEKAYKITDKHIKNGLLSVKINTGLRGRWDILNTQPISIADTAHNKSGLQYVLQQLQALEYDKLHIVLSVVNDKDLASILPLFPTNAVYYFSKAQIQRGLAAETLQNEAEKFGLRGRSYASVQKAYQQALQNAGKNDVIFVGGSTFTVAEVI
jgi:dihydrofolate synthase/folylpolyglutamate synthase